MPTPTTIADLNSLGSGSVILQAIDIHIPNTDVVRLVKNTENISFGGNTYIAFDFTISNLTADKGEVPSLALTIDNTTRAIEQYLLQYDLYIKQNGIDGNGVTATLYILNSNDLTETINTYNFELISFSTNSQTATFNLGADSPLDRIFPPRKIGTTCGWKFKDSRCAYVGVETTCNKTLTDCRARNNSSRFGGFIGLTRGLKG